MLAQNRFSNKSFLFLVLSFVIIVLFFAYKPANNILSNQIPAFVNINQPKFVFFDLGLNNGDSLLDFFGFRSQGFTGGSISYERFGTEAKIAKWEIYGFEANPAFNEQLEKVKTQVEKKHSIQLYNETAAWTYDGTIDFFLDTVNSQKNFWGSSLNKEHPDVLRSGQKKVTVNCKDISRILKQYKENDFIVIKMDIEGSEYDLLLDFMKKDVYKYIDYLAVEFHPQITRFKTVDSVFLEIMKMYDTKYVRWN